MKQMNEKKRICRRILAVLLSFAMILGCVENPFSTAAAEEGTASILDQFDAYYVSSLSGRDTIPSGAKPGHEWKEENGVLTDQNEIWWTGGTNMDTELSVLRFKQEYKDFALTVEFKNHFSSEADADDQKITRYGAIVGFGAQVTDDGLTTYKREDSGIWFKPFEENGKDKVRLNGTFDANGGKQLCLENGTHNNTWWNELVNDASLNNQEWHTMRLEVEAGVISFYVDNRKAWAGTTLGYGDYYAGGSVFLASSCTGTQFRNISITEIKGAEPTEGILDQFEAHYIEKLDGVDTIPSGAKPDHGWKEENGVLTDQNNVWWEGGHNGISNQLSVLRTRKEYNDFMLTAEFKNNIRGDDWSANWERRYGAMIGFGAKVTDAGLTTYKIEDGGVWFKPFVENGNDVARLNGTFNENGEKVLCLENGTHNNTWWGTLGNATLDNGGWHTMKLEVKDGRITFSVDGRSCWDNLSYGDYYTGGSVFLASNAGGTQFRNISIQEIAKPVPDPLPEELTNHYTAYRADNAGEFFSAGRTRIDGKEDWKYQDGRYSRRANGKMSYLYTNEVYTDFEMTFDYVSAGNIYIGAGAESLGGGILTRGSLNDPSATVARIWDSGFIQYAPNAGGEDGWFGNDSGELFKTDAEKQAVHQAKITVSGGMMSIEIDGHSQGSMPMQNYQGGHIYIGMPDGTDSISLPVINKIEEPDPGPAPDPLPEELTNDFTAYRANNADEFFSAGRTQIDGKEDWKYQDGRYSRRANGKMSYLYTNKSYTDFEMTFDYVTKGNLYIGAGAETLGGGILTRGSLGDPSATVARIWDTGFVQYAPDANGNDGWFGNDSGELFKTDAEKQAVHQAKISVSSGMMEITIDSHSQGSIPLQNYKGGHIYIGILTGEESISLPVIRSTANTNDFSQYDAYYTGSVLEKKLTAVDALDYWTENNGVITRRPESLGEFAGEEWDQSNYHLGNMAFLFLNGSYTESENYSVELDFTAGSDGWKRTYIGFGAKGTNGWRAADGGSVFFMDGGGIGCFEGNINGNGTIVRGMNGGEVPNWNENATHHVKLLCEGGMYTFYVDGVEIQKLAVNDFNMGGRIFLATNSSGTKYANITVKTLPGSTKDFSQYDAYYTDSVLNQRLTAVDPLDYWTEDKGVIVRRPESLGEFVGEQWDQSNYHLGNMAFLFLNGSYTESENYCIELDYTAGTDGWKRTYIGFGAKGTNGWRATDGGSVFFMDGDGLGCFEGNINGNGSIVCGMRGGKVTNWDENATHHVKLLCDGGMYTIYVDGVEIQKLAVNRFNRGGRIFLATNSSGTRFSNLTVETLPPSTNDFSQYDAYYTDFVSNQGLAAVNPLDYWAEDNGTIVRLPESLGEFYRDSWDQSNYHLGNMAFLFLNGGYIDSENYSVELDYTAGTDGWKRTYIGYGARGANGWRAADGGSVFFMDGGGVSCFEGNINANGITAGGVNGEKIPDWDENVTHHIKLVCEGGMYTFYVDGTQVKQLAVNRFNRGGRIFLATNSSGTRFSNLKTELLPPSTNDFSSFDAYYARSIKDKRMTAVPATDYWSENNGVIVRYPEYLGEHSGGEWYDSNFHIGNMAVLFLNGSYQERDNYILELDYTAGADGWKRTYIGFGARGTNGWRAEDGGGVFFMDGGGLSCFDGNINGNGMIDSSVTGINLPGWDEDATHHIKLVSNGGIYVFYVDGVEVKKLAVNKFNRGGRIFLATNSSGTKFSNISVKNLPADGDFMDAWDEWYGEDLRMQDLEDVPEGTNWSEIDGIITRKAIEPEMIDSLNYLDMAYLYLTDRTYENFHLEMDYMHGGTGWLRSPVGFGAQLGKHFMQEGGGIHVFSQPDGYVHFDGNVEKDGEFQEYVFWDMYDESGKNLTKVAPYDQQQWHHLDLTVEDGYATARIDDFPFYFEIDLPVTYQGGYIYLCSNSVVSQYKNIEITDLSANLNEEAQAGWQPGEKDYEFDFMGKAKGIVEMFDWLYKKLRFQ